MPAGRSSSSMRAAVEEGGANPQALARVATRAEIRQPGALERVLGPAGGLGFGGMLAGSLLGSVAGTVLGSAIAREFFAHDAHGQERADHRAETSQDSGLTDTDHTPDDSGDFDVGTFDV